MKKYSRLIAIVVLVLLFVLMYPNKQTKEIITEEQVTELTTYVVQVAKLNKVQESIGKKYDQFVFQETDQVKAYDYLADDLLPMYQTYAKEVEKIKTTDEAIQEVHALYTQAVSERLDIYTKWVEGYQTQTHTLYEEATKKVSVVNGLFQQYDEDLRTLAKRYSVTMPKEN